MQKSVVKSLPTVIGCLAVQLCVGILYLWSVFKTPVVEAFNWTSEAATMVSSYMLFAFVFGILIGGIMQDKTNPQLVATIGCILFCGGIMITSFLTAENISMMYFTYCIISGLGCGMTYGSVLSCMQKWMPHRRGLAAGLAVAAFGLSTVVFTPISEWLMSRMSVSSTFRVLAITFFVISMIACLFIKLPTKEYISSLKLSKAKTSGEKNLNLAQAIKTVPFWCIFLYMLFVNATWTLALPLVKDLAIERGLSSNLATLTLTMTGIFSAAGRLILAAVSDKLGRAKSMGLIALITLVCALFLIFITSFAYSIVVWFAVAVYGAGSAVTPAMVTDLYGPKYSGTNYGVIALALGLSSVIFNAISTGILKGEPVPTFIMGACTALVALTLMIIVHRIVSKKKKAA